MVYKNQLTPLSKGGRIDKVAGKGGQSTAMPDRRQIKQLAQGAGGIGNYAKAAPTMPAPGRGAPFGVDDLG
jgi:hypothetical protein